jgi:NAD(P)-dependent dehydrogenase (short-subunit alcohol dehydrogenase family)
MSRYAERVALVTGAGRAIADAQADAGASVVYLDFDPKLTADAASAATARGSIIQKCPRSSRSAFKSTWQMVPAKSSALPVRW